MFMVVLQAGAASLADGRTVWHCAIPSLDERCEAVVFLRAEADGVSNNPLIFVHESEALSGGNFHAEPVAFAAA